ncbi:MAG: zinc-ribbon domain-containing protein [Gaiellaceae bacterium]
MRGHKARRLAYAFQVPVCARCRRENPEDARFCLHCGAALEPAPPLS